MTDGRSSNKDLLKEHKEFFRIDLSTGWENVTDYPDEVKQKVLSGSLDEQNRKGVRTRLLRFEPGAFTTEPFEHEYYEEVFQVSGDLIVGGETFGPMTYASRPPHVPHGPFSSKEGCLLYEIHYFAPGEAEQE